MHGVWYLVARALFAVWLCVYWCYSPREEPKFRVVPKADDDVFMAEDMYSVDKPKAPYFTQQPTAQGVKEGHPVRFECTLLPIGDPNMSIEWYCNGELVKFGKF